MVYTDADEDAETMMSFAAEGAVKSGDEEDWAVTHTARSQCLCFNPFTWPTLFD